MGKLLKDEKTNEESAEHDALDAHAREFAAMADRAMVALAAAVLERDDLGVLALLDDLADDRGAAGSAGCRG